MLMSYIQVSKIDSKISIATVYRTVKLFEESGIVTKLILKVEKLGEELSEISRSFDRC